MKKRDGEAWAVDKLRGWTRKEAAEAAMMPERAILYYTERGIITSDVDEGIGRGGTRRYSEKNMVEIAVLRELYSMEISLGIIRSIMAAMRTKKNTSTGKGAKLCIFMPTEKRKGHVQVELYGSDSGEKILAHSGSVILVNYAEKVSEIDT
ncbi:MAG: MerR family transcriptional regulator [Syntrophales bacterium]